MDISSKRARQCYNVVHLLSSVLNIGQLMNWTMARLLHMMRHASDVISIQQVTVVVVIASQPASSKALLVSTIHEYYKAYQYQQCLDKTVQLPA